MSKITDAQAIAELVALDIIPGSDDFHGLSSDAVHVLCQLAAKARYKLPRSANGSTARYYFARLSRIVERDMAQRSSHIEYPGMKGEA